MEMEEILIYLSSAHRLDGRIGSYIVCIGSYIGIVNILLLPTIKQWQLHQLFHSIHFKWYQTLLHLQVVTLNLLHFCLTPFHCTSRHYYEIHSLLSTASSFTTIEPFFDHQILLQILWTDTRHTPYYLSLILLWLSGDDRVMRCWETNMEIFLQKKKNKGNNWVIKMHSVTKMENSVFKFSDFLGSVISLISLKYDWD